MFLQQATKAHNASQAAQKEKLAKEKAARRPWVEKYRPKTIDEVTAQEHTVAVLKKTLMSNNLPHMLFYGPPGTGKTSTILALARQLFGPELMKTRVLELNASDERGITVVREKIKNFAKLAVTNPKEGFPCPPFKIIILDEADSMTQDAQSALRRIMEQYSRITRFCLVCNYVTRIIEPLASRCSKFRFRSLDTSSTKARLEMIANTEAVTFEDDKVLDTLIGTSDGDLRRAITYLQSASRLHSVVGDDKSAVTSASIVEIAGVVPSRVISSLADAVGIEAYAGSDGDVDMDAGAKKRDAFDRIRHEVRVITREGYSITQLLVQLHDYVIGHPTLLAMIKAKAALLMAEMDKCLTDGADEELQLLNLCLKLQEVVQSDGKAYV
ncbi:p-loop containing nucleoside triphosphate hydrolase protein [Moesziomyces antarcticus]|uniref:Replication factor C subunit 2 n=1 Tax=Pseudozyma antarctica TaxID=84753 RepID=A0A5C3FHY5_PSEA2|nr:p-loop containing nucleoside triphosphate hydrolase protein [Moesziomyces antarcticus]GAK62454.1 p-loop containing nucleoside triphosphate hydrolase protein [Moesziomyces antarcticus]SPO43009.1 probable RFC2 - DNA replication factor C, 41 KD subunit [Moesziomyces antarcticus]